MSDNDKMGILKLELDPEIRPEFQTYAVKYKSDFGDLEVCVCKSLESFGITQSLETFMNGKDEHIILLNKEDLIKLQEVINQAVEILNAEGDGNGARRGKEMSEWINVNEQLPPDETPVLICMFNGESRIGELRWEYPSYEETYPPFRYWDCPYDDGQDWDWCDVTHWMTIPEPPQKV